MRILLVGNPNCGKTTLFNALTGDHQRVGNWPGVTVEKKSGTFFLDHVAVELIDLPGVYSLVSSSDNASQDEQITARAVAEFEFDCIINVVDAGHLERHLYLTSQLLELGVPMIVALNMMDLALGQGIHIQEATLAAALNCPVVLLHAHRHVGVLALKQALQGSLIEPKPLLFVLPDAVRATLTRLETVLLPVFDHAQMRSYAARRILEGDQFLVPKEMYAALLSKESGEDTDDLVMADARYRAIHQLIEQVQTRDSDARDGWTAKIDRIVLHRFLALPLFFTMMYGLFFFAIHVGGALQGVFDTTTNALFVQGTAWLLHHMHAPDGLIAWCANGIGRGINTTLTFIPVMASMYFCLSLLEASGYMARAAFVVDKVMRLFGLPGKAFVPMIVGFGCNVPAIMAARTLDSERDRLLTVLMSPFMSCSARLAIYAVFVAAFFPSGGQNVVFSLYLIGIGMAVLTGVVLRRTLLPGPASPLILELPAYHRPSLHCLLKDTAARLRIFIVRAGKLIIPVCALLGTLNACSLDGGLTEGGGDSILAWFGQHATPLFAPMGISPDNWPATVGLLMGTLAKEVVVGSLNGLYAGMAHSQSTYGVMVQHFDGQAGAYAYLLFVLLYIPCVSTMAAIRQEASRKLMWFSIGWSSFVAYTTAVLFYQIATMDRHPAQTMAWVLGMACFLFMMIRWIRFKTAPQGVRHAIATS
jgi:ferrous iron transport protein B